VMEERRAWEIRPTDQPQQMFINMVRIHPSGGSLTRWLKWYLHTEASLRSQLPPFQTTKDDNSIHIIITG
jgi:hypothetical protein